MRRALPILTAFALLVAGCSSGEGAAQRDPPNVVVITIDTLRYDRLPFGGNERETAPFLAELASRGTVFDRAFSTSSWTAPATASLFTGLYPTRHGVVLGFFAHFLRQGGGQGGMEKMLLAQLPANRPTLPELFQEAGYGTFGLATNLNIGKEFGFDRGFDRFERLDDLPATVVLERLIDWKPEISASEPFFLYLHLNDVHSPYVEHEPWYDPSGDELSRSISAYDSEISFLDGVLRRIHEELELDENTLLVVVSDHGEEFMDHGATDHKFTLFRELTQVLFLVHGPGLGIPAQRIDANVGLIDVLPTVAELAGLQSVQDCNGRSLVPLFDEGASTEDFLTGLHERPVFAHRFTRHGGIDQEIWTVKIGRWKLYEHLTKRWLFDLEDDRREQRPIDPAEKPKIAARLTAQLEKFKALGTDVHGSGTEIEIDPLLREKLEALGYVGEEDK